ncbi:4-carboxymuconolactone decarboxylase [Georgenia thermotolerans]|uniref:4-carboxymuconolactone decarboxylase n=2 Tax=Georgenia thermotolerans TaxID=527326 RepID=A0A7J5UTA7_9MICO|nr:4-carboxymuconolactone decarboxylase [Georgenia thermotolerans]
MGSSLGTDRHMWDAQVRLLERRYRVVRYELRGHGRSASPRTDAPTTIADLGEDVVRLMDHLGIERAHQVGLSIGGMIALWLAEHRPERVHRVAVVCSAAYLPPAEKWLTRAATVREQGMGAIWDGVVAGWFTETFADDAVRERMRQTFLAVEPEGYAQCCEAIAGMDLRPDLARVAGPVLVLAGRQDPATPPSMGEEVVDAVLAGGGQARLELVDDAAHIAAVQRPATVTRLLLDHLDADRPGHAAGMRVRREVLGDAHVDRAQESTTPLNADFQDFITRYAWGDVWTRPGLDRRMRSAITLALLMTLGHDGEFQMHVRAALRNGLTVDEIREVLLHVAVYSGVPVANHAYALATEVLRAEGLV